MQNIDGAKAGDNLLHHAGDRCRISNIAGNAQGGGAVITFQFCRKRGAAVRVEVDDGQFGAKRGKSATEALAQDADRASDNGDLAAEIKKVLIL